MATIKLRNVSVSFPIYGKQARSIRHRVMAIGTGGRIGRDASHRVSVQALNDVSLELNHGDRIALVGHNGSGKSTLLRVLAGIYEPTTGAVEIEGSVAPVFDFSIGMDPDSTGYENIRLRGLFLGLTGAEVERHTEEIAEFTDLGEFLQMPLRTYSAGMAARLAFAISTSVDPDILLLDEGVGAGDAAFARKAEARVQSLVARSGILVLATHSTDFARHFCNKALLLNHGEVVASGDLDAVLEEHAARQGEAPPPAEAAG